MPTSVIQGLGRLWLPVVPVVVVHRLLSLNRCAAAPFGAGNDIAYLNMG
jgi:hypothetical protein